MRTTPPFHLCGIPIPYQYAVRALDGTYVFETATDEPVQRWRTELCEPVPAGAADWAAFEQMLGGAA